MSYTKTTWADRNVEYPHRYTDELSNIKTFTPSPGTIYETGTTVSATTMNNIEVGIFDAYYQSGTMFLEDTTLTLTRTDGVLTQVDETIGGTLHRRTTLTRTDGLLTSANVKIYDTDGTTIIKEYTDTLTRTDAVLTSVTRSVIT